MCNSDGDGGISNSNVHVDVIQKMNNGGDTKFTAKIYNPTNNEITISYVIGQDDNNNLYYSVNNDSTISPNKSYLLELTYNDIGITEGGLNYYIDVTNFEKKYFHIKKNVYIEYDYISDNDIISDLKDFSPDGQDQKYYEKLLSVFGDMGLDIDFELDQSNIPTLTVWRNLQNVNVDFEIETDDDLFYLKEYAKAYCNELNHYHLMSVTNNSNEYKGFSFMNVDINDNIIWNETIPNSRNEERAVFIFRDHIEADRTNDSWSDEKYNFMQFALIAHELGHSIANLSHAENANNYVHTEYHNMDDYGPLSNNNYYCLMGAGFPLYFDAGWKFSFCKPDYYLFVGKRDTDSHTCCFENFLSNFDEF